MTQVNAETNETLNDPIARPEDWARLYKCATVTIAAANAYDWGRAERWMTAYNAVSAFLEECGAPRALLNWHRAGMMFAITTSEEGLPPVRGEE